jgi:hypothetical protein
MKDEKSRKKDKGIKLGKVEKRVRESISHGGSIEFNRSPFELVPPRDP